MNAIVHRSRQKVSSRRTIARIPRVRVGARAEVIERSERALGFGRHVVGYMQSFRRLLQL
ncbi:MAG: hypothetical protein ACLP8S_29290 [Solirubrobacteraceae bacterium]